MKDSLENIINDAALTTCNHPRRSCSGPEDGSVNIGKVATFTGVKNDKAQALKVLEEAAEVFGAWQNAEDSGFDESSMGPILDECADVVQATCNLLAAFGVTDFEPCMDMCRKRNEARGRFDD